MRRRVVFVTAERAREIRQRYGLFYPAELTVWFNHARTRAAAKWSASWVGGTLLFEKRDGIWQPPVKDGWIS